MSDYHPILLAGNLVACLSDPKTYEIMRQQLAFINELLHPKGFFMPDDQIRVANWDEACQKRHMTPGQQLADKVRRCTQMIEHLRPDAEIWDWSDMFDPDSNALGDHYAVNGSWAGSWAGLSPDGGIANRSPGNDPASAQRFADLGHKQIPAGHYDWDHDGKGMAEWLAKNEQVPGIIGIMYTTWRDRYGDLGTFAEGAWGKLSP